MNPGDLIQNKKSVILNAARAIKWKEDMTDMFTRPHHPLLEVNGLGIVVSLIEGNDEKYTYLLTSTAIGWLEGKLLENEVLT